MPNVTHISKWLQRAEPDYYSMFINAWIPFNAWYVKEYHDRHDRTCLNQIYSQPNKIKNKIKSYLVEDDAESVRFRSYVSQLQSELLRHPIPDELPIDLGNVLKSDNLNSAVQRDYASYKFKWEYFKSGSPKCKCIVTRKITNTTFLTINLSEWDELELSTNSDYLSINNWKIQEKVREFFQEIRPRLPIRTIIPPLRSGRIPKGALVIDKKQQLYCINDKELVSQAIIELLYQLRCMIFHGNIDPTTACGSIYEYAFHILRMIIKELV